MYMFSLQPKENRESSMYLRETNGNEIPIERHVHRGAYLEFSGFNECK